jgi:hypothetical protein
MFIHYTPRNPFVLKNNYLNKEERIILNILLSSMLTTPKDFLNVIPENLFKRPMMSLEPRKM